MSNFMYIVAETGEMYKKRPNESFLACFSNNDRTERSKGLSDNLQLSSN